MYIVIYKKIFVRRLKMNKFTKKITDKAANIISRFNAIEKAVVIGNAVNDDFTVDYDNNIWIALYTKPGTKISKLCCDLNAMLGDNALNNIDLYPMADEDFYVAAASLIPDGEVIFERK